MLLLSKWRRGGASAFIGWRVQLRNGSEGALTTPLRARIKQVSSATMRAPTHLIVAYFLLLACSAPDSGIDIPRGKDEILGCYYNDQTVSSIRIDKNEIFVDNRRIYNRYDYGITGRRNLPTILAWPGIAFKYSGNNDVLKTEIYGTGEGPINFSFVPGANLKTLRIVAFPNGTILDFVRSTCQS